MLAGIVLLFLIMSSVNILISDFRFAHKTADQDYTTESFDWLSYNTEIAIRKFVRSIIDDESINLT